MHGAISIKHGTHMNYRRKHCGEGRQLKIIKKQLILVQINCSQRLIVTLDAIKAPKFGGDTNNNVKTTKIGVESMLWGSPSCLLTYIF